MKKTQNYRNGLYIDHVGDTRMVQGEKDCWWCIRSSKGTWKKWRGDTASVSFSREELGFSYFALPEEYLT